MDAASNHQPRWNPRYMAYANAHNQTPEEMKASDQQRFPGGPQVGFILWLDAKIKEYVVLHPDQFWNDALHSNGGFSAFIGEDRTTV